MRRTFFRKSQRKNLCPWFPIKYATVYVDPEQKTSTNSLGEFTVSVPNKEHYSIILEFQYEKSNHIFYRVMMGKILQGSLLM